MAVPPPSHARPRLRVVTFNILHGRAGGSEGPGRVDLDLLATTCAGFSADVLALQEVDWGNPRSRMADLARLVGEAAGMSWRFGVSVRRGPLGQYGNALLVRGSLGDDVAVVPLPRRGRSEPRTALVGTVAPAAMSGRRLSVAATHLSIDRDEAVDQLRVAAAAVAALPAPRLLLGDLNLEPAAVEAPLVEAGLTRVPTVEPTFPAHAPRISIDHVAVSPDLTVERADAVQTPSSDHRALVVDLAVVKDSDE